MKPFTSHQISVRGHSAHVLTWGSPSAEPVLMLHGWMDVAASFQFLVDAMAHDWYIIAPDQRGYGGTEATREAASGYWFADYIADLDAVIDHFSPHAPIDLVGHSLGGNVCSLYAGIRPHRVRRLVSLDGFGIAATAPDKAAERYRTWLDAIKLPASLSTYASKDSVADRLQKNNPRITRARALWLAGHWAAEQADGRWRLRADPAHKLPFPTVYRLDEVVSIWQHVTAPTLWLGASDSDAKKWVGYGDETRVPPPGGTHAPGSFEARLAAFQNIKFEVLANAGHMLHHDIPELVAKKIEAHFVAR